MIHLRRFTANNFKQLQDIDLLLPERGRFLVQGLNEAGKSTFFEAVFLGLFGKPLATETAHARLDDVIRYETDEALVALDVGLADGRLMRVMRRVRRGRPNVWELEFVGADGEVEEVRGNQVVNRRVEAELGLDGDALLNTCFVEQKKLEKLEGLSRAQREESLMKLLNLDRLLALETGLKVRPTDQAQLARLRDRAELARLRGGLPELEARHGEVALSLARIEARQVLEAAVSDTEALAQLAAELARARELEAALAERAQAAERLAAGLVRLHEARTARDRALEAAVALGRLGAEIEAARRARDEEVPAILERGSMVKRLRDRAERLRSLADERAALEKQVGETDAALAAAARDREALHELRRRLVETRGAARDAETRRAALAGDLRAFEVQQVLGDWVRLREALDAIPDAPASLAAARDERDAAFRAGRIQLALLGALTLVFLAGAYFARPLVAGAALSLAVFWWRWWRLAQREATLTEALGRLEGQVALRRQEAEVLAARAADAAGRLAELNVVQPADRERARVALREMDDRLAGRDRSEVEADLRAAQHLLARSAVEKETLEREEAEMCAAVGRFDAAEALRERDGWASRVERISALLGRWEPRLAAMAAALEVALDGAAIERELGALRVALQNARDGAARLPGLERDRESQAGAGEDHWSAAGAAWSKLPAVAGLPEWSREHGDDQWDAVREAIQAAYTAAGGDEVRRSLDAAVRKTAGLAGQEQTARRALAARLADLRRGVEGLELAVALPEDPTREDLVAALDVVVPHATGDATVLKEERARLQERINVVRHDIRRLEGDLGLRGEVLDAETAAQEYEVAQRELLVRDRAAELVGRASRNVVKGILPSTIAYMRRLLPAMTDDRYFDAQLTDDYRIAVYDERAGDWKQKNIFSGGTKDQLSLALRLAFALATLPEERGAVPSFLFLDEPLGAFDSERARALVHLLTEGEIARSFDQIFLISHVRVDPTLFDYRITLADGRVTETNLERPEADAG